MRKLVSFRRALVALLLAGATAPTFADTRIEQVRASYLYNFSKFVSWPEEVNPGKLVIGIYESSILDQAEQLLAGRVSFGRTIEVVHLSNDSPVLSDCCQILYVGPDTGADLQNLVGQIQTFPVLIVTEGSISGTDEIDVDLEWGIRLVRRGTRLKFDVNLTSTRSKGLKVGSELLKNARDVL